MYLSTTGHVAGKLNIGLMCMFVNSSIQNFYEKFLYFSFNIFTFTPFEKKFFSFCLFIIDYNKSLFFMTRKKGLNYIFTLFFLLITRNYLIIIV